MNQDSEMPTSHDAEMPTWRDHKPVSAYQLGVDSDRLFRRARNWEIRPTAIRAVYVYDVGSRRYVVEIDDTIKRDGEWENLRLETGASGRWSYFGDYAPRWKPIPADQLPRPDFGTPLVRPASRGLREYFHVHHASRTEAGGWYLTLSESGDHAIEMPPEGLVEGVPAPEQGDELVREGSVPLNAHGQDRILVAGYLLWQAPSS